MAFARVREFARVRGMKAGMPVDGAATGLGMLRLMDRAWRLKEEMGDAEMGLEAVAPVRPNGIGGWCERGWRGCSGSAS